LSMVRGPRRGRECRSVQICRNVAQRGRHLSVKVQQQAAQVSARW